MKVKMVLLGEGDTEATVIPILFRRCAHLSLEEVDVELIEKRSQSGIDEKKRCPEGICKVELLLESAYRQYTCDPNYSADVFLVGCDNDNKKSYPPHAQEHLKEPLNDCRFRQLEKKIGRLKSGWAIKKLPSIIFVPVEAIDAWLLFQANLAEKKGDSAERKRELFPENFTRFEAKNKLCGTLCLTKHIIQTIHKPIAEKIDIHALRQNVKSFDLFFQQVENFMEHLNKSRS